MSKLVVCYLPPIWRLTCGPTKLTRTQGFVNYFNKQFSQQLPLDVNPTAVLLLQSLIFLLQTPKPVPVEPPAPASRDRVVPFLGLAVVHRLGALGTASSIWSTNDSHQKRTVHREADSWDPRGPWSHARKYLLITQKKYFSP